MQLEPLVAQLPTSLREALKRNDGASVQHALQAA